MGIFKELEQGNNFDSLPERQSGYQKKVVTPLQDFSTGFAKGILKTVKGVGQTGEKIGRGILGGVEKVTGLPVTPEETYSERAIEENRARGGFMGKLLNEENLTPQNTAEKVGFGAEKIAEFAIPASKVAKTEQAINTMFKGSGLIPVVKRIVGKTIVTGLADAVVGTAQTGSFKEGAKTGLIGGGLRGGFAVIGEGANALKIPQKLYTMIFKNTKDDMLKELRSGGIEYLQKTDPDKYNAFVKSGIIKVGKDGSPIINDTIAEAALDKGLKGSIPDMGNTVVKGMLEKEDEARSIVKNFKGKVKMPEKQFVKVFKELAEEYQDVGFGELSDEATELAKLLKASKGSVSADTALKARRFLDKMRLASSYDKPAVKMSTSQANLKTLSDAIRSRLSSTVPGLSSTMKDYSFYIEALESLAKEGARRGNNQIFSLVDSIFFSGAFANNNPIPLLTIGAARKAVQSPQVLTRGGQAIKNTAIGPVGSTAITTAASLLTPRER